MRLPRLSGREAVSDRLVSFQGINVLDTAAQGTFVDMQNLSSDHFPYLSIRKPRGTVQQLTNANGLLMREKMFYIDGQEAFYDGKKVGDVTDSEKTLLSMGAYILIFPDKISYNTADGKWESMENSYTSTGTVTYKQSYLTETDLDPEGQIYVKIEAAGIEEGFAEGDGVEISGFNVESLNKTTVLKDVGDGYILIVGPIDKDGSQTESIAIKRTVPDMDFYTVSENRLWGCSSKNHEIYASKLGSFRNFNCFDGVSSDSYAATIASDGDFTGAITYLGYVMFWKENAVYKVYGNRPSNFQIVEGMLRGVAKGCEKSLCIVNEVLYYKSENSVMSFQGALPTDVGAVLEAGYGAAEAGRMGNKYYISMEKGIFVYDTAKGLWHREDNTKGRYFSTYGSVLYYLDGNTIKTMTGADEEVIEWYADTNDFTYNMPDSKFVSRFSIRMMVPAGAAVEIYIQYDSTEVWQRLKQIGDMRTNVVNVPVIPRRCDHFRLRFAGYGPAILQDMTIYLTSGSNERR